MLMIPRNADVDDSDADTDVELLSEWSDKQIREAIVLKKNRIL